MIRSYRYPLRPTKAQEAVLLFWLASLCDLYNAALQERREAWKRGVKVRCYDQHKSLTEIRGSDAHFAAIPAQIARSALNRLDNAFKAFFARCKRGAKPGYPRFKSKRQYDSLALGQHAARSHRLIHGSRVQIPKLGAAKVRFHRPIPTGAKVLDVIVRRDLGKWFVIFQCDLGAAPAKPDVATIPMSRQVGIDVGLSALATLSTGEVIANPKHGRDMAAVLARRQRALARKKRGSKSRRKALLLVQKAHATIANRRKDTAYKVAAALVRRYDLICFEALLVVSLASGMLSKAVHDAAWRLLLTAITCKAESAGKYAVAVDPNGTTIECSACDARVPKTLAERTHRCACGLVLDRDHNAALNIWARGRRAVGLPATQRVAAEGLAPASA